MALTGQQPAPTVRQLKTLMDALLLRDVKVLAARRGSTIRAVVSEALEQEVQRQKERK